MSVDAERSLLGSIFIDQSKIQEIMAEVEERDFSLGAHRTIYRRLCELVLEGVNPDIVTFSKRLDETDELAAIGGAAVLAELVSCVPTAANCMHYARIVSETGRKGRLKNSVKAAYHRLDAGENLQAVAETLKESSTSAIKPADDSVCLQDMILNAVNYVEAETSNEKSRGIKTGFRKFDSIAGGLIPGQLVIVAARPSVGKTIFADQLARQIPANILFFCLEMTVNQMALRRLISQSGISIGEIKRQWNEGKPELLARMNETANSIYSNYYQTFYNDRFFDISKIVGSIHAEAKRKKIGAVIIDYVQLLRGKGKTRNEEIGLMARSLKETAKELSLVVILVSQLNRLMSKEKRAPALSDLRDSGELEQAADIVIMLHSTMDAEDRLRDETDMLIRKYRDGYPTKIQLRRDGAHYRFLEVDNFYEPERNYCDTEI